MPPTTSIWNSCSPPAFSAWQAGFCLWAATCAAASPAGPTPRVAAILLALCSYLVQAVVSIRVSMVFPEVMLLFALLAAWTSPKPQEQPAEAVAQPRGKKARRKAQAPVQAGISRAGRWSG